MTQSKLGVGAVLSSALAMRSLWGVFFGWLTVWVLRTFLTGVFSISFEDSSLVPGLTILGGVVVGVIFVFVPLLFDTPVRRSFKLLRQEASAFSNSETGLSFVASVVRGFSFGTFEGGRSALFLSIGLGPPYWYYRYRPTKGNWFAKVFTYVPGFTVRNTALVVGVLVGAYGYFVTQGTETEVYFSLLIVGSLFLMAFLNGIVNDPREKTSYRAGKTLG